MTSNYLLFNESVKYAMVDLGFEAFDLFIAFHSHLWRNMSCYFLKHHVSLEPAGFRLDLSRESLEAKRLEFHVQTQKRLKILLRTLQHAKVHCRA